MLPVRPSGANQWHKCTASHNMQVKYPELLINDMAEIGTACHWLASEMLMPYVNGTDIIHKENYVDTLCPENNVLMDEEMWDSATEYVMTILKLINPPLKLSDLHVEESLKLDHVYDGMSGTPDCWFIDFVNFKIHIFDLKYGYLLVDVFENLQLMLYLSGILKLNNLIDTQYTVVFHIYQPRVFHEDGIHRTWEINASDIRGFINKLEHSANVAMTEIGETHIGVHCHYCSARKACKTLQNNVYGAIDIVGNNETNNLKDDEIGIELKLLKYASDLIQYRLTSIEEEVLYRLTSGKSINGYNAKPNFGRKRWSVGISKDEVLYMGDLMGIDLAKPRALDTPTQAIKKLKSMKLDPSVIDAYSEIPSIGFKLVEDNLKKLRKIFS